MTIQTFPACVMLDGIRLANLALDDAVTAIDCALTKRQPTRIAFVNADCANIAAKNEAYREDLQRCDWVFVDGIGMRIAGEVMNQPVRDNVNGTDLFPHLCGMLAERGHSIYLLGGRPGIAEATARWAESLHPDLRVAGTHHGYFTPDQQEAVLADIRQSGADVVLVAMGAPRQEAWINANFPLTGATIAIGVGGLFDYYSGRIPRAPVWMRRLGLEWVFRLIQEPTRLWRRYLLGNLVFLCRLGRARAKVGRHLHHVPSLTNRRLS